MRYFRSNTTYLWIIQILFTIIFLTTLFIQNYPWIYYFISFLIYAIIGCFGISIGYHRYLCHKSFLLKYPKLEYILSIIGMLACTGSPIGWVAVHRKHHEFSDKIGDPHSPHISGWKTLFTKYDYIWDKWPIRDLIVNKFHRFLHDKYYAILLAWATLLILIPSLVTQTFNLTFVLFGFVFPGMISIWVSTISNYVNHMWGYHDGHGKDKSRNLWINALFTFGEGWHANHHKHPGEYRFGRKWWELDFGAWIIEKFLMVK